MNASRTLVATFLAFGIAVATVGTAVAQSTLGDADETGPGMMQGHHGSMGQMGPGKMQGGMMQGGMMQGGMMQGGTGTTAAPFGTRVTPMMNLSVEDVRSYLDAQLERLNNKRLKVGDVKANDGTITADIVTVDNSLVQRLKINRRTGAIEYEK
ncbi:MAG: hypothetical protein ACLP0B_30430 [Steroidobacteraceae bacterium]|jgi:hypothetical protein